MGLFPITAGVVLAVSIGAFFYFSDPDIPRATLERKYVNPPSGDYTQKGMVEFVRMADRLGLGKLAIGGHSMGGGIAERLAETYPERVARLILVDAVGMPSKPPAKPSLVFRVLRAPVLNQVLLHITPRSVVVQTLNSLAVRKSFLTDAMADQFWEFLRMTGTRQATFARSGLSRNTYVKDHIGDIKAPPVRSGCARLPAGAEQTIDRSNKGLRRGEAQPMAGRYSSVRWGENALT